MGTPKKQEREVERTFQLESSGKSRDTELAGKLGKCELFRALSKSISRPFVKRLTKSSNMRKKGGLKLAESSERGDLTYELVHQRGYIVEGRMRRWLPKIRKKGIRNGEKIREELLTQCMGWGGLLSFYLGEAGGVKKWSRGQMKGLWKIVPRGVF